MKKTKLNLSKTRKRIKRRADIEQKRKTQKGTVVYNL